MKIFRDLDELKNVVNDYSNTNSVKIITIDGKDGSGKSYLADYLSKGAEYVHLNLDEDRYLVGEQGNYVDFIRYENLQIDLKLNLDFGKVVILDGICILKILKNMKLNSELKIYVKKLRNDGFWYDGENFDYTRNVDEILMEKARLLQKFRELSPEMEKKTLDEPKPIETTFHEIIRYHHEYKPDKSADFVYERYANMG